VANWEDVIERTKRPVFFSAPGDPTMGPNDGLFIGEDSKDLLLLPRNKFHARIEPGQDKAAEDELRRELDKESFRQFKIVGQFNKGFIVATHGPDVFIVDQHASDEKWNFERLQRGTKMNSQMLIR
jgi:DNA mismatch repair ATPase MutL